MANRCRRSWGRGNRIVRRSRSRPGWQPVDYRPLERASPIRVPSTWLSRRRESPQEVLVPIGVFAAGEPPAGWDAAPPAEPSWWFGSAREEASDPGHSIPVVPPSYSAPRRRTETRQPDLFAPQPSTPIGPAVPVRPVWIDALLASPTYEVQQRLAGRASPPPEQVGAVLSALTARGGRLSRTALAQALSMPAFRIAGLVNATRRVLNLDQAQVLAIDGDDIVLNEAVLRTQFSLGRSA